jgi:hypothetical protein
MGKVNKKEFEITQLFRDNEPGSVLNTEHSSYFIFAYELNPEAID